MKTRIYVSYNCGGWSLCFKTDIELPFTPFYEMSLMFDDDASFHVTNNNYTTSTIYYDLVKNRFLIEIRNNWGRGVRDDVVDEALEIHSGWDRIDTTDINKLKDLMRN